MAAVGKWNRFRRWIWPLALVAGAGYFYFFNQFWTHVDPSGFQSLMVYEAPEMTAHRGRQILIHRDFLPAAETIRKLARTHGITLVVTQAYRAPGKRVTDAVVTPAVRSNHLAGHALDMNPRLGWTTYTSKKMMAGDLPGPVRDFLAAVQAHPELRWGGVFSTPDPVHLDVAVNRRDPPRWARYYGDCSRDYFNARPLWKVWLEKVYK